MKFSYLPNAVTLSRLFLVPVLILVLKQEDYVAALAIFLIAGVSDALDGFIAKRFNLVSQLGAVLDPLADKVLLVSAYIMLTWIGHIPFWLVLAVAFRDLLIVGGYLVVTSVMGSVHMNPSYISKLNTVLQIVLVLAVLAQQALSMSIPAVTTILVYLVLITTVASGVHYIWLWGIKKDIEPLAKQETTND